MTGAAPDPSDRPTSPPVLDRVRRPPGLVSRHAQTWVLLGLAVVMIVVIAFTGQAPSSSTTTSRLTPPPLMADASQARIEEYRTRIDEQAKRLAAEQSELALTKRALADAAMRPGAPAPPPGAGEAGPAAEDALTHDYRQRDYRSLFADNLALTLRAKEATREDPAEAGPARDFPAMPRPTPVPAPDPESDRKQSDQDSTKPTAASAASPMPPVAADKLRPSSSTPGPPTYPLLEGTLIDTVLLTRLGGAFAGPVICQVTTPVYASDYQRVLIPRGSRLLGAATPVTQVDQQRLAVTFHRLLLPNGQTVQLDKAPGLTQTGETGLRDRVDRHYPSLIAAALGVGAIAGLAQMNTGLGAQATWSDAYRQGASSSLAQSSLHILDRFLNRLPTVTIREGHRVTVYLTRDLHLPAYETVVSASVVPLR